MRRPPETVRDPHRLKTELAPDSGHGRSSEPPSTEATIRWVRHLVVAAGLALVAAWVRRHGLGPDGLNYDDAWVVVGSSEDPWYEAPRRGLGAGGFALLLRPFLALTGGSTTGAQLPAFIMGCLTPAALYLVLVERRVRALVAVAASAVLVASPIHARVSASVKQYTADGLIALVVLWLAWRLIESGYRRRTFVALLTTASIGAFVSFQTAVVAVPAIAVSGIVALRSPDRRFALGASAVAAAVCGALYVFLVAPNVTEGLRAYWGLSYIRFDLGAAFFRRSLDATSTGYVAGLTGVHHLGARLAAVVAVVVVALRRPGLAVLLAAPVVITIAASIAQRLPFGGGRTDVVIYPSLLIAGAVAASIVLDEVQARWGARAASSAAVGACALGVAVAVAAPDPEPYIPDDMAPIVELIDEQRSDTEPILLVPGTNVLYAYYSDGGTALETDRSFLTGFRVDFDQPGVVTVADDAQPDDIVAVVRDVAEGADGLWVLGRVFSLGGGVVSGELERLGFTLEHVERTHTGVLWHWIRG